MILGRSLFFLLGATISTTTAVAAAADETRLLSSFHHSAKKSIAKHARRVLAETQKQQEQRRRHLEEGDFTLCMLLGPMFDAALESDPNAPEGSCTCDDTTNPEDLTIACAFTDVCDDTQLYNGEPTCASSVEISYTIGGISLLLEDLFETPAPGEEDSFELTMTSMATVDMSNPDLEVYTVSFQIDLSGAFDDIETTEDETTLGVMGSCNATYATQPCECTLEIENLVDEDMTNDDDYCINVDCSMVTPDWPPMKEGSCNNMETDETGTSVEASSFLLAFDDTAPGTVTDDGSEETTDNGSTGVNTGDGEEGSGAFRFFSMAFLGSSLAATFLMV